MNTPSQTTEFSAHLSWAGMRRYLQETLSAEKSRRVERHLHHCPRCSSAIIDYIQAEEPAHYKQYTKKLKGILKTGQTEKKSVLSSFQMKAIRTTTAVVALLIFSFFALRTVINKQADHPLPSESLAVAEQREEIAPARRSPIKKATKAIPETATTPPEKPRTKKTAKAIKKAAPKASSEVSVAKAPTVITKARTASAPKNAAAVAPAQPEQPQNEPKPQAEALTERAAPSATETTPAPQEVAEAPANETASRKSLPALPKIKTAESAAAVAPMGSPPPAEMPVPSNKILER